MSGPFAPLRSRDGAASARSVTRDRPMPNPATAPTTPVPPAAAADAMRPRRLKPWGRGAESLGSDSVVTVFPVVHLVMVHVPVIHVLVVGSVAFVVGLARGVVLLRTRIVLGDGGDRETLLIGGDKL